jgi:hypothetical protein
MCIHALLLSSTAVKRWQVLFFRMEKCRCKNHRQTDLGLCINIIWLYLGSWGLKFLLCFLINNVWLLNGGNDFCWGCGPEAAEIPESRHHPLRLTWTNLRFDRNLWCTFACFTGRVDYVAEFRSHRSRSWRLAKQRSLEATGDHAARGDKGSRRGSSMRRRPPSLKPAEQ